MKKVFIVLMSLSFFSLLIFSQSNNELENRKNEIKKYFSLSYDIDRYKSPIFLRIYENIDFDQIRNNGYNGYYSKTIKNSGISNVEELFFIKITEIILSLDMK